MLPQSEEKKKKEKRKYQKRSGRNIMERRNKNRRY